MKFLENITEKMEIDENSIEKIKERFWKIEGNDFEDSYVIYDCSKEGDKFDYQEYAEMMNLEEGISYQIIVFRNWECEIELKKEVYKKLKNATERKNLLRWFDRKISYYTELEDSIKLEVKGYGENYLEYANCLNGPVHSQKIIKGRIYNLTFFELKKIFNVRGKDLFRKNVRFGLKDNKIGNQIRIKFKKYIKTGIYEEWKKRNSGNSIEKIKEIIGLEEDYTEYLPENFWFYHNGVTVFYYGKANIDFSGTTIKLNPQEISVINGAQTITNFFEGMKEIEEDIENIKEGDFTEEKNSINKLKKYSVNYIEEVLKRTKVKVIFIDGEEDFLKPITYGLNTQIPIVESDIIADSKDVNELNEKLKRKSMKICKSGEEESIHTAFSLLDFVKKYLITQFKPGTSKNLQKKDLLKYIKEANEKIDKNTDIIDEIEKVVVIEEWWKSEKKERESFYGDAIDEPYLKYGKNYFESFILISNKEPLDDDSLILAFGEFLKIFRNMERNVSDKTFKQDSLFEKYQENLKKYQKNSEKYQEKSLVSKELKDELKACLNNKVDSKYKTRKIIVDYLNEKGINIPYFRVIAYTDGKPREAYPFPNTTFSELYKKGEEEEYLEYRDSLFCKEIHRKFPVFVIDWREDVKEGKRIVNDIFYLPEFTFEEYDASAKEVYESTIKAFEDGDENEFIKMGDGKDFHIRPKAVNSEDTFEFTNGRYITKRTFWANKTTVEKLISDYK